MPGVSTSRPPPGSRCSSRAVVVCRPRPSPARTSRAAATVRPASALARLDLPTPDGPTMAAVRPGPTTARTPSSPSPVTELTASTSTPRASSATAATAAGTSSQRSALVRTTTGTAPLPHATARYRSMRHSRAAPASASTTRTVSRLAAMTCAADVRPATLRVNAERRGSTATASSPRSATQSPTAGEARPASSWRAAAGWTRRSPVAVRTVSNPRSTRATRAGSVPSGSSPARSGFHHRGESSVTSAMLLPWSAPCRPNSWANHRPEFALHSGWAGVLTVMHATAAPATGSATRLVPALVVGHRGACAYRPEHTLASFELAIELGADLIEPDVVVSADGALVVRHESELSRTTDVAERPEFASRRTTRLVGAAEQTGWFTEDFTLAELRTLRAVERMPALRPLSTAYDGEFGILTLAEVVELARSRSTADREVRVLAELKKPWWSASRGLPMTDLVAAELRRLDAAQADGPVVLQSFDAAALRALREELGDGGPQILQLVDDRPGSDVLVSRSGLREVSTYAQGIAPSRHRILVRDEEQTLTGISDLVTQAHRAGLSVVPWTLRAENAYLPRHLRRGTDPAATGDGEGEARLLLALGVDGLITDSPDIAVQAREELVAA